MTALGASPAPIFFLPGYHCNPCCYNLAAMFQFSCLPPLSLYIHFPWCVRKCPYCDFNSHEIRQERKQEGAYIESLIADLETELPRTWGRTVVSIFMGGGTPSLFSPESIDRLLSALRARLPLSAETEITLEANPGTVEQARFAEYRDAGVNRLSIGIQSFHDAQLQALGRIHTRREAILAAEAAHLAGFENFNLDLMFALAGQALKEALDDVQTAIALEPAHLSYYQLTIESNTLFHHHPPALPDEDIAWQMQESAQTLFHTAGYRQYEVSAYARPGKECVHNLNYWRFGDYLGIGAGAHDKITDAHTQTIHRNWKVKHPDDYLATAGTSRVIAGSRTLSPQDAVLEFMMNALRLTHGFDHRLFSEHTGLPLHFAEKGLQQAEQLGWLKQDQNTICPTARGRRFLDDLISLFLPDT